MRKLYAFIKFIAMGSLTLILTACYGAIEVMYGVPYRLLNGKVRIKDSQNTPIPGLSVVLAVKYDNYQVLSTVTDQDGVADLQFEDIYSDLDVKVIDTDGENNGGTFEFNDETTIAPYALEDTFQVDINLTEAVDKHITLTLTDREDNPLEGLVIFVSKASCQDTPIVLENSTTDSNGQISFTVDTSSMEYEIDIVDETNTYKILTGSEGSDEKYAQKIVIGLEGTDETITQTIKLDRVD